MKRIFPLIAIGIIASLAISDIKLLLKCLHNPNAYSAMVDVSFVHYMVLHEWGVQFAAFKLATSGLLFVIWLWKLFKPSPDIWVGKLTEAYALLWACFGFLILTGMEGVLQHSAGLPIKIFDFTLMVFSLGAWGLAFFVGCAVLLPLVLMLVPIFYNRCIKWDELPLNPPQ